MVKHTADDPFSTFHNPASNCQTDAAKLKKSGRGAVDTEVKGNGLINGIGNTSYNFPLTSKHPLWKWFGRNHKAVEAWSERRRER